MKKTIILDSRNRLRGTSTNFDVNINPPISFRTMKLKSFHTPVSWYNVTSANKTLTVEQSAITNTVTIAEGRYTMTQLLSAIETELINQTGSTFTVTISDITGLITIQDTTPTNFIIKSNGSLDEFIGFTSEQTGAASYTASKVSKLYDPEYLVLSMSSLTNNIRHLDNNSEHGSFIIRLDDLNSNTTIGDVKYNSKDNDIDSIHMSSPQKLHDMNVYLLDKDNNELVLNGSEWFAVLHLE